jgi:hypothetical protein
MALADSPKVDLATMTLGTMHAQIIFFHFIARGCRAKILMSTSCPF